MAFDRFFHGRTTWSHDWPPPSEDHRVARYEIGHNLFRGYHQFAFIRTGMYSIDMSHPYIVINLCGALTRLLVSRSMADADITIPSLPAVAEWLDSLCERSSIEEVTRLACSGASYRGDAVIKVSWDPEIGDSVLSTVDPSNCIVRTRGLDRTDIVGIDMGQILCEDKKHHLLMERYSLDGGTCILRNELFPARRTLDDGFVVSWNDPEPLGTLGDTADLPPEIDIGITRLPFVWIANARDDESGVFGISDYEDLESIQGELNQRYTERACVLSKHTDPVVVGPRELLNELGEVELGGNAKFISTAPGEKANEVMAYVVWDASLTNVENEITSLERSFAAVAGIDAQALLEEAGAAIPASGRAIRLGQYRTQARVVQKQDLMQAALQAIISIASEMSSVHGSLHPVVMVEDADVVITFEDGLPSDPTERIEQQTLMLTAKVQSRKRAIMALHALDGEEAEALMQEIDDETQEIDDETQEIDDETPGFVVIEGGDEFGSPSSDSEARNLTRENGGSPDGTGSGADGSGS